MTLPERYVEGIKLRGTIKYNIGLLVRCLKNIKYASIRNIARFKGATIGNSVIIPLKLALKANANLIIKDDVICESHNLDLRGKIIIDSKCIINKGVQIIRVSHYIDNDTEFGTRYYPPLTIESYSWLCTGCHILPSVTHIAKGSVVSAFTTLLRNTEEMDVIGSNGTAIRKHNTVFSDLLVCKLMGGDFHFYHKARHARR